MADGCVAIIGSLNVDLVTRTIRLPRPGETVAGEDFETVPGGKGANQALAAARGGARSMMFGAVGSDGYAAIATDLLRRAGVDLNGVRSLDGSTGIAQIAVDRGGENTIIVVAGANGRVDAADAVAVVDALQARDIVLMQMEVPPSVNRAAMKAARKAGIRSIFNTAPYTEDVPELAALADFVVCNETEFDLLVRSEGLSGQRERTAQLLANKNRQTIIVTLGRQGAFIARGDEIVSVPSIVVDAVDTVGAGDTFCGVLAAGLARGIDVTAAARTACVAAALSCTKRGAQTGIPSLASVQAALKPADLRPRC